MDNFGFLKVAAAIPSLRVGDCTYNMERTAALAEEAARIKNLPLREVEEKTTSNAFDLFHVKHD